MQSLFCNNADKKSTGDKPVLFGLGCILLLKTVSSPYGNRTRVSAVRGRRLNRLTNEPLMIISSTE